MTRTARSHDGTMDALAAQLVESVAGVLDQAGLTLTLTNTAALTSALNKALQRVGCERERSVRQIRIDRRATWVREQDLRSTAETAHQLRLTLQEMETARNLGIVTPIEVPPDLQATSDHFTPESWRYYPPDIALTDTERALIAHETLLTRGQAAERLGMSLPTFDRLRMEHGLAPVEQIHRHSGSQLNHYRTDAVDRLAAAASRSETHARQPAR